MPINFACPYCGKQTVVADQFAGQSGPCAGCGKTVNVPYAGSGIPPIKSSGGGTNAIVVVLAVLGIGGLLFIGLVAALLIPAVGAARNAARRAQSMNNLRQIGIALHNYHDVHGCFPPQYVVDASDKPLYSWRVLILPYLEQDAIYKAWQKDKAWDSPENASLSDLVLPVFRLPDEAGVNNETSYLAIAGKNAVFDGAKPTKIHQITDGTSNTLIVVESKASGIRWAEPRDLDLAQLRGINTGVKGQMNGAQSSSAGGLLCDGSVRTFSTNIDPKLLQQLGDRQDGQVVQLPP